MLAALLSKTLSATELAQRVGDNFGRVAQITRPPAQLIHLTPTFDTAEPTPASLLDGDDLALIADARIDNRDELCPALGIDPADATTLADTDLIAAAYRRWGEDCAGRIIGDFAFVLWDAARQRLVAACDPMGMRTLCHARRGTAWALASTPTLLLALLAETPRVDRLGLAGWLVGRPLPDASVLADIEMLPAGHVLTIDPQGARVRPFWQLDPNRTLRYPGIAPYAEHLHELLGRCVADRLPAGADTVAAQLSGGMDSTSVSALAAARLPDPAHTLLAVSHLYTADSRCDERDLIEHTAQHLGIRRHLLLPVSRYTEVPYPELYPPTLDSPGCVLSPRYLDELRQVRDQGARVLLTGSGGDEMTWGHSLSYSERLRRGDLGVLGEVLRGSRELGLPMLRTVLNLFVQPLVPDAARRLRRRLAGRSPWPDWMPADTARELNLHDALYADPPRRFRNRALQARLVALTHSSTYHSVRSYQAAGERTGVDVRHPFFDRRLAEFSFAIPDDLWLRERYPKWLLRKAMDGRLPDSVNWNRNKVVFDHFFAGLIKDQRERVRAILSHPGLQALGLVDNARLLAAFDAALDRDPPTVTVDLLHALMTQLWFQRHAAALGW